MINNIWDFINIHKYVIPIWILTKKMYQFLQTITNMKGIRISSYENNWKKWFFCEFNVWSIFSHPQRNVVLKTALCLITL